MVVENRHSVQAGPEREVWGRKRTVNASKYDG